MDGVVLLDVDGTLVDTNHLNVLAWSRAFRAAGHLVPRYRIEADQGMGGDLLVPDLVGDEVEAREGDALRDAWAREITPLLAEIQLLPGAQELLRALAGRGLTVVLASSGKPEHVKISTDLLDCDDAIALVTSSEDADATKPAPDLFQVAWARTGKDGGPALVVGDSPYDCEAAARAGIPSIGLRTGGFSDASLTEAGAARVYEDPAAVVADLDAVLGLLRQR